MHENQVKEKYSSPHDMAVEYHSFLAPTGYTQAAMDNIRAMESVDIKVSLRCVHGKMVGSGFSTSERKWLSSLTLKDYGSNAVQMLHAIPPRWSNIKLRDNRIAIFVFENTKIPDLWIDMLSKCRGVIVPSMFNFNSLKESGLKNVFLVNHAVDLRIWNTDISTPRIDENKHIRIITVGTWRQRKNWKQMLLAIVSAQESVNNIHWTIKVDRGAAAIKDIQKWLEEVGKSHLFDKYIKVDSRILDEYSMARLVSSHDLLLSASLGEGFGLPALQACFVGLPVVCPMYGGYTEFFDPDCYYEIKCSGFAKVPKMDSLPQFDNLEWPIYEKDSILDALYSCIGNLEKSKNLAHVVARRGVKKFNHKTIGMSFINVLNTCNAISSDKNP